MTLDIARILVTLAGVYTAIGALFALAFAFVGAGRLDPVAKEGSWGFRLLILPGALALWPRLAHRGLRGAGKPPAEHNPHRDAASGGAP